MKHSKTKLLKQLLIPVLMVCMAAVLTVTAVMSGSMTASAFVSDYTDRADLRAAAVEFNRTAMEEGMTLIKNEDNALPLTQKAPRVTVFGKNSVNLVYSGSGSSGGVGNNTRTLDESLKEAGIMMNPVMRAFYEDDSRSGIGRAGSTGMGSYLAGYPTGETRAVGPVDYSENGAGWTATTCPAADMNYDPATTENSNYESVRHSYSSYDDAAIVVISRIGGEGYDLPRTMRMSKTPASGQYPDGTGGGRFGGEAAHADDAAIIPGASSKDDHYLQLDRNEINMLKEACYYFDNVIVVLNCATQFELGFLDDPNYLEGEPGVFDNIKAALWMGTPGENGIMALGSVLNGTVNPSGGLISTYYRDFKNDPTWLNFGNNREFQGNLYQYREAGQTELTNSQMYFVDYQEGIYMGYRYYETRWAEEEKVQAGQGDDWYADNVTYPIGHGLSYTDFSWEVTGMRLDGTAFESGESLEVDGESVFEIDVEVTNTGDTYTGKDVVQVYATAPYTDGGIEKSHKVLVGFAKTDKIAPGESDTVTVTAPAYYFASYDYDDKNSNNFKGYELEAGAYTLSVAQNSHDDAHQVTFNLDEGVRIENDPTTDGKVENAFDEMSTYMKENSVILSRNNNFANIGQLTSGATRRVKDEAWLQTFGKLYHADATQAQGEAYSYADNMEEIFEQSGALINTTPYNFEHPDEPMAYEDTTVKFFDMYGLDYNDPKWDTLLNQLTFEEMSDLIGTGAYHNRRLDSIGKPDIYDFDGPVGWTKGFAYNRETIANNTNAPLKMVSTCIIAATYNVEIAYSMGRLIGDEGLWGHEINKDIISGWYAPGANTHRSPFSGRNFEYFSEDGVLGGTIMAHMVMGAQDKGVYSFIKHYFLNDQETDRNTNGLSTWADEQTMRELYAKPFEISIKLARANNPALLAVMTSYNRLGRIWAGGSYAANTTLLRNEWGFSGVVITDNTFMSRLWMNPEQAILSGNDKMLMSAAGKEPDVSDEVLNDPTYGNTYKWAIRNAAHNILYVTANSNATSAQYRIFADYVNLTNAGHNASGVATEMYVGMPVSYSLADDIAPSYKPYINYGDRSEVEFTYSVAEGFELPEGLTLSADGTISGTPKAATVNASTGRVGTVAVGVRIHAEGYLDGYQQVTLRVNEAGEDFRALTYNGAYLGKALPGTAFSGDIATATRSGVDEETVSIRYSVKDGYALPAGLTLGADGKITGTVTSEDVYTANVVIVAEAVSAVDGSVIETAEAHFTIAVGEVSVPEPEPEPVPEPEPEPEPGGCGSFIGGSLIALCAVLIPAAGIMIVYTIKKRKDK